MRTTRRVYAVALGATALVLAGSMAGAMAYAANSGVGGANDNSWGPGGGGRGGMMGGFPAAAGGGA
jgi:Spy/CpxP family protein refolding chaperone